MKKLLIVFALFSFTSLFGQVVIDTIKTSKGTMLIYANRTWKYLEDKQFNGVLNPWLHSIFEKDTAFRFTQKWDNNQCFTSERGNDMSKLKDTFWLCVMDEKHKDFKMPVPGIVTSRYGFRSGRYHNGIDLDLNVGDTVRSVWAGKIRYAKWNDGGFGNLVIVRHYNGLETFYAHLSKHLVVPDQLVEAGEPIGLGGNTGRSFGAHLHFEVRFYDAPMNPEEVIDFTHNQVKDENLFIHSAIFRPGAKPSDAVLGEPVDPNALVTNPTTPTPPVRRAEPARTKKYYKVRPGDTLSEIATRNNTTVSKICSLNGLRVTSVIQPGQSLRVK